MMTETAALDTSRLSPRRPTATSPARPGRGLQARERDGPAVSAKMRSFHVGVVPRSIDADQLVDVRRRRDEADDDDEQLQRRSAMTSAAIRFQRVTEKPRMLRTAT